ncbi:hypothetical protein IQ07DRAFT_601396 [Pyrenochaeta sp. DS3sAY3a]|nr:hypothetical protein IQ07DRAFT_601396 [Pyrenochaeta sp. DS3sAY3a]
METFKQEAAYLRAQNLAAQARVAELEAARMRRQDQKTRLVNAEAEVVEDTKNASTAAKVRAQPQKGSLSRYMLHFREVLRKHKNRQPMSEPEPGEAVSAVEDTLDELLPQAIQKVSEGLKSQQDILAELEPIAEALDALDELFRHLGEMQIRDEEVEDKDSDSEEEEGKKGERD